MNYEQLGSHLHIIGPMLNERKDLPGDIAEFGVFAGATTVQLANFGRQVWAFDTFTGIPAEQFTAGLDVDEPGKFAVGYDALQRLSKLPNVATIAGLIEQTLPHVDEIKRGKIEILLAYVDVDLYKTTAFVLDWLAEHMVPGGAIVLDDFHTHPGIRQAIAEFLVKHAGAQFNGSETILWP
jgi:hypothetical protein